VLHSSALSLQKDPEQKRPVDRDFSLLCKLEADNLQDSAQDNSEQKGGNMTLWLRNSERYDRKSTVSSNKALHMFAPYCSRSVLGCWILGNRANPLFRQF
jgi:hypothetical protein